MKTYRFILLAGIAAILSVLIGCSDENDENTYSGNLIVYNYINSGCTNKSIMPESSLVNQLQEQQYETIRLTTVENNKLQIEHKYVQFNCAAKLEIEASIDNSMIYITERDTAYSSANCMCPYNLSYEVSLPGHGEYILILNEEIVLKFTYNYNTDTTFIFKPE